MPLSRKFNQEGPADLQLKLQLQSSRESHVVREQPSREGVGVQERNSPVLSPGLWLTLWSAQCNFSEIFHNMHAKCVPSLGEDLSGRAALPKRCQAQRKHSINAAWMNH